MVETRSKEKSKKQSKQKSNTSNREAVAKHYQKNGFEVQKKRKIRDIEAGKKVRVATIIKYGLQREAKTAGLPYEDLDSANVVNQVNSSRRGNELKRKIEDKLEQYDLEIAKMVAAKVEKARAVAKGKPRITGKLVYKDLVEMINQAPNYTAKTKADYQTTLKTLTTRVLKCNPKVDLMPCFNDYEQAIKNIKKAKTAKGKAYESFGRFYSLPISLAKHIPEFDERLTKAASNAYKREMERELELKEVKMAENRKKKVVRWDQVIKARDFWLEEYEETKDIQSYLGYVIMALYTMIPPLRDDYGCLKIVHHTPTDKNENYYNPREGKFYLNIFKTMKKYPDEPPILFPQKLKKVVNKWIKLTGAKKYVFSKKNSDAPFAGCDKPGKHTSFSSRVKWAASRWIQEKGQPPITINVLRKSKASSIKTKDIEYRMRVARAMRHQVLTQAKAYVREEFSDDSEGEYEIDDEDPFLNVD